jgi:diguanylate cyclase (GGDEF)-like protein
MPEADPSPFVEEELLKVKKRLDDSDTFVRRAMLEKGAMVLRGLEAESARAHAMAKLADRDLATGLMRHGFFRLRLEFEAERSRRTGQPLALLLVDLDNFSLLNRNHGYEAGEVVLRAVGQAIANPWIARPARRPPVLAREAADSYAILLPGADADEADQRAETVRDLIERLPLGKAGRSTASLGAVVRGGATSRVFDASQMFSQAKIAVLQARSEGGNRVALDTGGGLTSRPPRGAK